MGKKLVSDLMINYLERRGVTKLFGLCGHTVIGMLDALSSAAVMRRSHPPRRTATPASPTRLL